MFQKYFTGVGLEITETHLHYAHVSRFGRVLATGTIPLPEGLFVDEQIVDEQSFLRYLQTKKESFPWKTFVPKVNIVIPESRVFSTSFYIRESVSESRPLLVFQKHAQKQIPLPESQAAWYVEQEQKKRPQGFLTCAYAMEKRFLDTLKTICSSPFGVFVVAEPKSAAFMRMLHLYGVRLKDDGPEDVYGLMDIGTHWLTISVYTKSGVNIFSRSLPLKIHQEETGWRDEIVDKIHQSLNEIVIYLKRSNQEIHTYVLVGELEQQKELVESIVQSVPKNVVKVLRQALKQHVFTEEQMKHYGAVIGAGLRAARGKRTFKSSNFNH